MTYDSDEFKIRIKKCRKEWGLTQEEVATSMYISQAEYSRIESGKRDITISQLIALCNYFEVNPYYLLGFSKIKDEDFEKAIRDDERDLIELWFEEYKSK